MNERLMTIAVGFAIQASKEYHCAESLRGGYNPNFCEEDLREKRNFQPYSDARQIFCHIVQKHYNIPRAEAGEFLNISPNSVSDMKRICLNKLLHDKNFDRIVSKYEKKLRDKLENYWI